jgi:hypothetical protein
LRGDLRHADPVLSDESKEPRCFHLSHGDDLEYEHVLSKCKIPV